MACVTCPEQFTPEYEKLCGVTPNEPEVEEPVSTEAPTEEIVTFENESDDNSIEGISQKYHRIGQKYPFFRKILEIISFCESLKNLKFKRLKPHQKC